MYVFKNIIVLPLGNTTGADAPVAPISCTTASSSSKDRKVITCVSLCEIPFPNFKIISLSDSPFLVLL